MPEDWEVLRDAYGSAAAVPELLAAAEDDDRAAWDNLWSRLCHQGTVYTASYAALPLLTKMAARRPPAGYVEPLALAAAIIASEDGPEDPADVRRRYATELAELHAMAGRNLKLADSVVEFVYALQALLSFEDVPIWKNRLEALADGEIELDCPTCHEHLLMDLGDAEVTVRPFDDTSVTPTTSVPADPSHLSGSAARMHAVAVSQGRTGVAKKMLHLLGLCICPCCHARFEISSALPGSGNSLP